MSFESPQNPRDEMEARLTALLLGELSAEEEGTLRAALAQDAALAQQHDRLARTIGLVREAAGSLREEATPPAEALRLSAARREKLLQSFKVIRPQELQRAKRRPVNWREWAAVAAMGMGLLAVAGLVVSNQQRAMRSSGEAGSSELHFAFFDLGRARPAKQTSASVRAVAASDPDSPAFSVAVTSDGLASEAVSHETFDASGSRFLTLPTLPSPAPPLTQVAQAGTASKPQEIATLTLPRGGQIALPQLVQVTDGTVDHLTDFDSESVAVANTPVEYSNRAESQKQDSEVIAGSSAHVAFSVGVGGLGGQRGAGLGGGYYAFIPDQATTKDAPVASKPNVISGGETKADAKPASDALALYADTTGALNQSRELQERTRRLAIAAVDSAWEFVQTPPPAASMVIPPPPPPAMLSSTPTSSPVVSDDYVSQDAAASEVLRQNGVRSRFDFSKTPAPAPAAQPMPPAALPPQQQMDKQLADATPVNAIESRDVILAFKGIVTNGTVATDNFVVSTGLPPVEQENLFGVVRKLDDVALRAINASEFNAPADAFKAEAPVAQRKASARGTLQTAVADGRQSGLKLAATSILDVSNLEAKQSVEEDRVLRRASTPPIPQPEITTAENAFSTFSLNVSDVSFKLAAAALEKGQMPDPATVRSEEFINAFDYRDPEPKGSAPVAFAWERARYPFAHNRDLLRFSIKTAATGRQPGRPLNLVLLLDNSGSMERADRVRIIQECLRVLARQLQPQDRVSVVAFARTPRLWVDGLPGNQAGELGQRVGGLTPQGGTNLEDAMNLAYQTAARHFLANGVNRVVLLTDGAANLGDVEPASLKKKVEAHRQQGIALDCFGIGWEGFNDELLESLSRNGDGRYGFVNSPEAAATEFAGQLAGALQVAASDVKVQVEFNPRRVTGYRQIGYAKHQLKKEQFRDNTVDAAEIAAAEAGNALYTVEVNPSGEGPLATVRVRFKIPGSNDYREHEWAVPYDGAAKSLEQSTATLRLAGTASAFSEWLVASPFAGEVTPDRLLTLISGVPETFAADPRPKKLVEMLRQAKSVAGK